MCLIILKETETKLAFSVISQHRGMHGIEILPNGLWSIHSQCYIVKHLLNTLRPRQNGRHYTDDTFKCIFLNENVRISIEISLKFVPKGPINNIPALVQIMAWTGQAPSHYLNQLWFDYRHIYAWHDFNEFNCLCLIGTVCVQPLTQKWVFHGKVKSVILE